MRLHHQGFTLIELLVVIAIIGLLSSVVLASMNSARMKARDARRKADLKQIQIALQLYYDTYGVYPPAKIASVDCGATFSDPSWATSTGTCGNRWLTTDDNFYTFLSLVPVDPLNSGATFAADATVNFSYSYRTSLGGILPSPTDYNLVAQLENQDDADRCGTRQWNRYIVSDPGPVPWCPPWANNVGRNQNIYADH